MQYDPIKHSLGNIFNRSPWLRIVFYRLLDLLLLRSWYIRREISRFAKNHGRKAEVLDAGSGFGQYSWFMAKLAPQWHITGVDVKPEQINDCNRFFSRMHLHDRVSFRQADLLKLQENDCYDLIICIDVMEHITDDQQVFRNFYRAMKTPSLLLISTPSDKGGSNAAHPEDASFIEEHVRNGYNIYDIKNKLRLAGFSRVEAYYSYGIPGKIAWKLSMKYPISLLNTSKGFFVLLPFWYLIAGPFILLLNLIDLQFRHREGTGLVVKAWKE